MSFIKEETPFFLSSGSNSDAGNLVFSFPNSYRVTFPSAINIPPNCEITIDQLQYTNSTRNVTAALKNNTFQYIFNGNTRTVTFPDGNYAFSDLNGLLQTAMRSNGDYMLDSTGNEVFFIAVQLNAPIYAVTFTLSPIAVPPGGSANGVTTSGLTPQVVIPNTNIDKWIGISPGTYPSTPASVTTYLSSDKIPQANPVTTVIVNMVGVNRPGISHNPTTLYSFNVAGSVYGAQIVPSILNQTWLSINPGAYHSFDITLTNQNGTPLTIVDPTQFFLLLKVRPKK